MRATFTRVWKLLVVLLVGGVMLADLVRDLQIARQAEALETSLAEAELSTLPLGTDVGERAPGFVGSTVDGQTVRLADLRGKVVVLNAFASWCGPCLVETPHLVEVAEANPDESVFIGLNQQEQPDAVLGYRDDFGVHYALVLDPDRVIQQNYAPRGLPTTWFIGPDGIVRYVHTGPMTRDMLQKALDDILSGRDVDLFAG